MATYAASIPLADHAGKTLAAMVRLSRTSEESAKTAGVDPALLEFVKYRASVVNGCSYCIHMHAHDARELGVVEERLVALSDWERSDVFDDRERAALALTDAITRQGTSAGIDPDALARAVDAFGEEAAAHVVLAAMTINAWNVIGVASALTPDPAWGEAPATA